ncbi:MAG: tetratricopeptide repeat protein [Gemmatimonadetes bacterium]|nr:tetratricopeptide repeat protein [Gemmatimonadota bacterium]
MTTTKQNWLLVGLVLIGGIALWLMSAPNQGAKWESYITAAQQAYQQADYAEAEKQLEAALKEAEAFGPDDVRLATSLNNLALLYADRGRYAESEPLHQRALAIRETVLGPEHPAVATSLENYADLLRKTGRVSEATEMEARAKTIRAKPTKQNP